MLNRLIGAIEPFVLMMVVLAGATLAGWIKWVNSKPVGLIAVFCGILLAVNHIYKQIQNPKK